MTTEEQKQHVRDVIVKDGMTYGVAAYIRFEEIDDEEFHDLRRTLIAAIYLLAEHIDLPNDEIR